MAIVLSWRLRDLLFLAICAAIALAIPSRAAQSDESVDGSIASSGGQFFRTSCQLPVADLEQDDPRWAADLLGPTKETLGDQGCTLTSVAMVLNYYGFRTNPAVLNDFLSAHDGYDAEGLLSFERVELYAPRHLQLAYEGAPSFDALDHHLHAGHPVIVRLTLRDGGRHFVVVMGKSGFDYLARDPAALPAESLVLLKNLSPRIEEQFVYLRAAVKQQ